MKRTQQGHEAKIRRGAVVVVGSTLQSVVNPPEVFCEQRFADEPPAMPSSAHQSQWVQVEAVNVHNATNENMT